MNTLKMKKIGIAVLLVTTFGLMSFTLGEGGSYDLLTSKSKLEWIGKKVGGEHRGTVDLKSGKFEVDGMRLTSGEFVIDMTTMVPTDTKGSDTKKLTRHLRSEDFFNVKAYPTAKLVIKETTSTGEKTYTVKADMTILGKTHEITFDAKTLAKSENFFIANAHITIDRTKWGITYKSSLVGDAVIRDNFDVNVKIFGKLKK